jgi:hypothetical protein
MQKSTLHNLYHLSPGGLACSVRAAGARLQFASAAEVVWETGLKNMKALELQGVALARTIKELASLR